MKVPTAIGDYFTQQNYTPPYNSVQRIYEEWDIHITVHRLGIYVVPSISFQTSL